MATQIPATSVEIFKHPKITGYIVTKWEPATKFKGEERVKDEEGREAVLLGWDKGDVISAELVLKSGTEIPEPLTVLSEDSPGTGKWLITSDVKLSGTPGGSKKISVTLETFEAITLT
ncbi:MAG: hypothetical protein V1746_03775 [bacterium]